MYPCPARVRTALGAPSSHCHRRNPPQGERRASPAKPAPPEAWKPMHMTKICSSFIHHGIEIGPQLTIILYVYIYIYIYIYIWYPPRDLPFCSFYWYLQ